MAEELIPARRQAPSKTGISETCLGVAKGSPAAACN